MVVRGSASRTSRSGTPASRAAVTNACPGCAGRWLVDSGASDDAAHDPAGAVAVHPLAVRSQEYRALESFADGEIDRAGSTWREWDGNDLAALAQHRELRCARSVRTGSC